MAAWRHNWRTSAGWKLLQRAETWDETGHWGKVFRSKLMVPRVLFETFVAEARSYPEIPDHRAGDGEGKKSPPCIPLPLKVAGILYWGRRGGALGTAADFVDIDESTLSRFGTLWAQCVAKRH